MIPPVYDESEIPERLRRLLAMEIDRILEDLEFRRAFLVETWSRHRDRGPLLDTVFSRWRTLTMTDLALIDTETVIACDTFYRELDELRLYFQFTQDMPSTLDDRYADALQRIAGVGALAVQLLGGAPERPLVEFETEEPPSPAPTPPGGRSLLELVPAPAEGSAGGSAEAEAPTSPTDPE